MNHRWNLENRILPSNSHDGNERTERGCPFCGLWKITVHYPYGRPLREWRLKDGTVIKGGNTPHVCIATKNVIEQPREVPAI